MKGKFFKMFSSFFGGGGGSTTNNVNIHVPININIGNSRRGRR
jgi:hypothetical protein